MSRTNTHRKPTTAQKLLMAALGIGAAVVAYKKPNTKKVLKKLIHARGVVVDKLPVVRRHHEEDLEELAVDIAFRHGGPLDDKGRKQVELAVKEAIQRLTGVNPYEAYEQMDKRNGGS